MRHTPRLTLALLAALLLAGAASAFAQDWPQWRGPTRDGKVTGFTAPQAWPKELTQKWSVPVGKGDASPALVGDRLYLITRQDNEEVILCLGAADGKEIWRDHYPAMPVTGPDKDHPGARGTPAVEGGKVLTLGIGGVVSCYDAASGKRLWRKNDPPAPQAGTSMSPIIVDGLAIVHLGAKGKEALVAYDMATGDTKWEWKGDGPAQASPALMTLGGTKIILAMTGKYLVGVNAADGKLLLQTDFPSRGSAFNAPSPVVDGPMVYISGQGRGIKAIKIAQQGAGLTSATAWICTQLAPRFNTPLLRDGHLFSMSDKGYLFCLNAADGKPDWTDATKYSAFCSLLDAGTVLLALTEAGDLIVMKPNPAKYEEVAKFKVSKLKTYAHPILSGNRIFVKDQETLTLYTL